MYRLCCKDPFIQKLASMSFHKLFCTFSWHTAACTFSSSVADEDGWRAEQRDGSEAPLEWSSERQDVAVISDSYFPRYFIAPGK